MVPRRTFGIILMFTILELKPPRTSFIVIFNSGYLSEIRLISALSDSRSSGLYDT